MATTNSASFNEYLTIVKNSFTGGLNTIVGDTKIGEDEYNWLINGRVRFNRVIPIKKHTQITLPPGNLQNITTVGNFIFCFIAGKGYYKRRTDTEWTKVPSLVMSSFADIIYTCKVPASTFHFVRKLDVSSNIYAPMNSFVDFKVAGTPAGLLVQDGEVQPWIIIYDESTGEFVARETKKYADWKNVSDAADDREYVPIGRQMMFLNNKLFIVSQNRKTILQSVTGRPLDFVVNVDVNGNKLAKESEGGADSVSFAVDYDNITCLQAVNAENSFLVASSTNTRVMTLDYTNTIFGEPRPYVASLITTGIINQESLLELIGEGDYAFVNEDGVISFNATEQQQDKGRNTILSLELSYFLRDIKQQVCSCVNFNGYSLFNLDTTLGNILAVYDSKLKSWVSFDITEASRFKQFAVLDEPGKSTLYGITVFNEMFALFEESTTYPVMLKTKAHVSSDTKQLLKGQLLKMFFNAGTYDGSVTVVEYADYKISPIGGDVLKRVSKNLDGAIGGVSYAVMPPVIPDSISRTNTPTIILKDGFAGKKLSYLIQWDNDAELLEYELISSFMNSPVSLHETNATLEQTYGSNS